MSKPREFNITDDDRPTRNEPTTVRQLMLRLECLDPDAVIGVRGSCCPHVHDFRLRMAVRHERNDGARYRYVLDAR